MGSGGDGKGGAEGDKPASSGGAEGPSRASAARRASLTLSVAIAGLTSGGKDKKDGEREGASPILDPSKMDPEILKLMMNVELAPDVHIYDDRLLRPTHVFKRSVGIRTNLTQRSTRLACPLPPPLSLPPLPFPASVSRHRFIQTLNTAPHRPSPPLTTHRSFTEKIDMCNPCQKLLLKTASSVCAVELEKRLSKPDKGDDEFASLRGEQERRV